jgi:integrase
MVQEIDHANKVWTVPGERMKTGAEHRVPLSRRAAEIAGMGNGGFLFPSRYSTGKPVSDMMLRALAHISGDKVERAYMRSDLFEKRRALMHAWSQFCASPPAKGTGKVVPLKSAR